MSEEKVRRESSEETPGSNLEQEIMELRDPAQDPAEVNDAEDMVQDAFARLLDSVPDAAGIEDANNYFLKVLQNARIDRSHSRSRLSAENSVSLDASKNEDDEQPIMELRDPARGPAMDAEIKIDNEKLLRTLESHCADLTKREKNLLALHLQGLSNDQIASAWREDVKIIRVDMNAVVAKIRYRLLSAKTTEILESAAVAYERIAKDQEEIEQIKTETRALLAGLPAA